jgi:CDGSH-type Zn-finger protein
MQARPKIACLPDGPYYLLNDAKAEPVPNLRLASGEACSTVRGVALCRCGGSKNKPFCDGTHGRIGFSDRKLSDGRDDRRVSYAGKSITIFDNRALCAHAGYCTDGLKAVFRYGETPWIDPEGAAVRDVIATIERCPSGALGYAIDGVEGEPPQRPPMVTVTKDGPYAVTGGVELPDVARGEGASAEHYTLCRCGASKNKPFCDGSHWDAGFKDGS